MYEDSLLDAQYEDRFYAAEDEADEDESCQDGCDPFNMRVYSSDEDQCTECGRITWV